MFANVFTKTTRDRQLGLLVGALSIAVLLWYGMAVYRTVDVSFYDQLPPAFLELMGIPAEGDVASLAFGAMYNLMGALTLAGLAISMGSASIAGEEANGTIGLLLGNPVSRRKVLLSKAASIVLLAAVGSGILLAAAYAIPAMLNVDISGIDVPALVLALLLNTVFYGFLAMVIGAWTGKASTASGGAVAVMMVGYIGSGVLPLIEGLGNWAKIFPWYYFSSSQPMLNGVRWSHIAVLGGVTVLLAGLAVIGVNRRDLRSHGVKQTMLDRLRANPLTARVADKMAGSARVSGILAKTLSEHQGLLIGTGALMFYMGLLMGPLWGFIPEDFKDFVDQFPDALLAMVGGANMSTAAGFYQAEIFAITGPIAIIVLTVSIGARALAGEEEKHTMGLLLANPISRSTVVREKALAMVIYAFTFGFIAFLGVWVGDLIGGVGLGFSQIAGTTILLTMLGLVYGGVALMVTAATGKRTLGVYAAAGLALVAYFMASFLPVREQYAGWARLSPFHYYLGSDPLVNGMSWGHGGVLAGLSLGLVALSIPLFQRRDLRG